MKDQLTQLTQLRVICSLIAIAGVLWLPLWVHADPIRQSYEIYQQDAQYKVRGQIDFKEYFSSAQADQSIQFALDTLGKGGEVYLHPGTYTLVEPVLVPSYTSLRGGGSSTVLQIAETHRTGTALLGHGVNRITISDLTVRGGHAQAKIGILIDHGGDCQVEDVLVVGMRKYGIELSNNSFLCEIRGAKVANAGVSGIFLHKLARGGRGGDYVPNLITNCIVYGGNRGITCDEALVINIVGCQVYQTASYGFHIRNGSNSVLLSGCRTYQISDDAVVVEASHEINISSNIFCWHTGHGLVLRNVLWGTVTGNNIIDSGSINLFDPQEDSLIASGDRPFTKRPEEDRTISLYNGIVIASGSKGLTVSSNAIFSWPVVPPMRYGIAEDSTCFSNLITANNINFCQQGDILSQGKETEVANNVSYIEEPHYGKRSQKFQYYDTRLLDKFVEEINTF